MDKKPNDKLEAGQVRFRRDEKLRAGEIREQSKLIRWLDNYWYHYKWPTIFVALALVFVIVVTVQMTERKEYDFQYLYAGPVTVSESDAKEMKEVLAQISTSESFKSPEVGLISYYIKAQSQITPEDAYISQMLSSNREAFSGQVLSGEALIFFLDKAFFAEQETAGFLPVRDYLPDLPDSALAEGSECGLRLDATVLYEYECFRKLPPDTVVCLRTPVSLQMGVAGLEQARAYHDRYEDVFRRLCDQG